MMEKLRTTAQGYLRGVLSPIARWLGRLHISPNQVTLLGLLITLLSAGFLVAGWPVVAGITFLIGSACDLLDGALARVQNQISRFGAFLDSTLDRLGEGAMFAAIAYQFALQGDAWAVGAVVVALLGGMLTSYTRARAESLGIACSGGVASRPERVVIIGAGLVFNVLPAAIYTLAILTLLTTGQRMWRVYRALSDSV